MVKMVLVEGKPRMFTNHMKIKEVKLKKDDKKWQCVSRRKEKKFTC